MFDDPALPGLAQPTPVPVDRPAAGGRVRHDDHLPVLAEAASALTGGLSTLRRKAVPADHGHVHNCRAMTRADSRKE